MSKLMRRCLGMLPPDLGHVGNVTAGNATHALAAFTYETLGGSRTAANTSRSSASMAAETLAGVTDLISFVTTEAPTNDSDSGVAFDEVETLRQVMNLTFTTS